MNPSKQIASIKDVKLTSPVLYWRKQLAINAPILEIPADFPRAADNLFSPDTITFSISAACVDALKQLSKLERTSVDTILLSAYNTLLFRYTKQEAIVMGLPGVKNIFSKTSKRAYTLRYTKVFWTDLSANPTFIELLKRVQRETATVNTEKEVTYEELLERIKLVQGVSCTNLYDVIFSFRSDNVRYLKYNSEVPNVDVQRYCDPVELALDVEETTKGLNTTWTYNTVLFHATTIKRLAKRFELLLENIVSNPGQAISQLC